MLEVAGLTRSFGDVTAVKPMDLEIGQGEIFGFLGHNGAGKTTSVLMLTTLLRPTAGRALIAGHDVVTESLEVRRLIGYLPENVQLYGELTADENLRFFGELSGVKDLRRRIDEVALLLNFREWQHRKVKHLSKGMRQRIGIAQAILHRPKLLFLDEPASGLDPQGTQEIRELLLLLNREFGTTIFMNTHLLSEVTRTCTSIGIIRHGELLVSGSLDSLLLHFPEERSLEDIYLKLAKGA
jgi:ABC-2 type transport system ATP-binding protein